jgi:hypothetical protein
MEARLSSLQGFSQYFTVAQSLKLFLFFFSVPLLMVTHTFYMENTRGSLILLSRNGKLAIPILLLVLLGAIPYYLATVLSLDRRFLSGVLLLLCLSLNQLSTLLSLSLYFVLMPFARYNLDEPGI